jgi:hypothetical protein
MPHIPSEEGKEKGGKGGGGFLRENRGIPD